MGIAFINFRSHHAAVRFQEMWHRCFLWGTLQGKHLDVVAATIQGLVSNLKQFTPKSLARLEQAGKLPAFFDDQGNRSNSMDELRLHGIVAESNSKARPCPVECGKRRVARNGAQRRCE